jgi:hypothetical protein
MKPQTDLFVFNFYFFPAAKKCFFIFLFFFPLIFFTQTGYIKKFKNVSGPEKKWVIFHPFCALKARKLTAKALLVVTELKEKKLPDQFSNGGKLDAFRHAYTMAFLAQKIPVRKLRKLGKAHEKGNYLDFKKGILENGELPDSLSSVMDLLNNEVGFETGRSNKKLSADSLKIIVLEKINGGRAYFMKRNEKGNYLSCDGKEILLEEWKGKWYVPKCLIQK